MRLLNRNRLNWLDILVLAAIILVGLVHLPFPFTGDQAFFTVGAAKLNGGGVLYRDYWDVKQPGIFAFYLLAGKLFSFNELGVHAFELLYMAAFSVFLIASLKGHYEDQVVASVAPLLTVGVYYAVSGAWHLTQVEGLVGFPMFLSLWFASESSQPGRRRALRLFVSGLMGGIVLLFKFMFLPILVAFWLTTLFGSVVRKQEKLSAALLSICAPVGAGLLLPLLITFAYFAWFDATNDLFLASFGFPVRMLNEFEPPGLGRLYNGLHWFVGSFAPLMALAAIGAYASLSRGLELMTLNLVLWFILGLGVILLQRFSWYEYHYMLLFVPLGILAARGVGVLWSYLIQVGSSRSHRRALIIAVLSLCLLFSPLLMTLSLKAVYLARDGFAITQEQRIRHQGRLSREYQTVPAEVAFLSESRSLSGDIFVLGNPLYYLLSGRGQAIALNGWGPEAWFPEQWSEFTAELSDALPSYIFVETGIFAHFLSRSPESTRFLEKKYHVLRRSDAGVWYVLQNSYQWHGEN